MTIKRFKNNQLENFEESGGTRQFLSLLRAVDPRIQWQRMVNGENQRVNLPSSSVPPRGRLFAFILSFVIWVAPNCNGGVARRENCGCNKLCVPYVTAFHSSVESCLPPLTRRIGSSFANGTKVCAASSFHKLFPQGGDIYLQYLRTDLWRTLFCASLRWIRCCKMAGCAGTPKLDAIKQESVA